MGLSLIHIYPETFRIDPEIIRQRALETHPAMIIGGWSAYPRIEDFKAMKEIADEVGAKFWVDICLLYTSRCV